MKAAAAFIGPTVWELDGPMPILKMSKTLTDMAASHWVRGLLGHGPTYEAEACRLGRGPTPRTSALVFRHRVAQPHPRIFGEGAARIDVVGRRVIYVVQDDAATGQQGLGALAGADAPDMKVQAAALHEGFACAGAGQPQAGAVAGYVGDGGVDVAERFTEAADQGGFLAGWRHQQPLVGAEPEHGDLGGRCHRVGVERQDAAQHGADGPDEARV